MLILISFYTYLSRNCKLIFISLLLLFSVASTAQQKKTVLKQVNERGEVYLLVNVADEKALNKLNEVSSIDKQIFAKNAKKVYVYVSKNQIEEFEKLNLDYLLQTPPSLKATVAMCADLASVKNWNCYPTYSQYLALMNEFVTNYPDLCKLEEIGTSVDGRSVLSLKISDNVAINEEEPAFFYSSTMHGDEVSGYHLMLRLIDYLLSNYQSDSYVKELVDNTEIWINPLANPDGTYYAGNSSINGATRSNSNGVDLNRNFPDPENGPHPDNKPYQKETLDMMNFMTTHPFVLSANFHGGAEVVNYPWDTWEATDRLHADNDWYVGLSRQYADTVHEYSSGYMIDFNDGITHGATWYSIDGGRQDYVNYYLHSREVTIELSEKIPDASYLPSLWNYNYRSFLNYINRVHLGLFGKVTDAEGNPIKAKVFIENHDVDSSSVYSNLGNGMYYRLIEGGSYTVSYRAKGFISKTYDNISLSDTELKRLDVTLEREAVLIESVLSNSIKIKSINNPFSDYILADITLSNYSGNLNISLYDSNGRLCKKKQLHNIKTGNNSLYLETNNLQSGLYILHISTKQIAIRKKMVKQ